MRRAAHRAERGGAGQRGSASSPDQGATVFGMDPESVIIYLADRVDEGRLVDAGKRGPKELAMREGR